ncbi:hypothetical protein WN48_04565, partial [Eufriesea mexicana]
DERRRTGRYVAGGAVLAIMLLAVHHALLRDASTITGVCIPAIIMVSYIIWILYSAHRDRRKLRGQEQWRVEAGSRDDLPTGQLGIPDRRRKSAIVSVNLNGNPSFASSQIGSCSPEEHFPTPDYGEEIRDLDAQTGYTRETDERIIPLEVRHEERGPSALYATRLRHADTLGDDLGTS